MAHLRVRLCIAGVPHLQRRGLASVRVTKEEGRVSSPTIREAVGWSGAMSGVEMFSPPTGNESKPKVYTGWWRKLHPAAIR